MQLLPYGMQELLRIRSAGLLPALIWLAESVITPFGEEPDFSVDKAQVRRSDATPPLTSAFGH